MSRGELGLLLAVVVVVVVVVIGEWRVGSGLKGLALASKDGFGLCIFGLPFQGSLLFCCAIRVQSSAPSL